VSAVATFKEFAESLLIAEDVLLSLLQEPTRKTTPSNMPLFAFITIFSNVKEIVMPNY